VSVVVCLLTAADRSTWIVAASAEAFLVLELVEVGAADDWSSEAGRLARRSTSHSALHLYYALQYAATKYPIK